MAIIPSQKLLSPWMQFSGVGQWLGAVQVRMAGIPPDVLLTSAGLICRCRQAMTDQCEETTTDTSSIWKQHWERWVIRGSDLVFSACFINHREMADGCRCSLISDVRSLHALLTCAIACARLYACASLCLRCLRARVCIIRSFPWQILCPRKRRWKISSVILYLWRDHQLVCQWKL